MNSIGGLVDVGRQFIATVCRCYDQSESTVMPSFRNYKREQAASSNGGAFWRPIVILACVTLIFVSGCRQGRAEGPVPSPTSGQPTRELATMSPPAITGRTDRPMPPPPTITPVPTVLADTATPPAPTVVNTQTPSFPAVTIAVIGDYGLAGPAEAEVATLVKSWSPDLIVTTGDNNYPDGAANTIDQNIGQYYSEFISSYQGAFTASEGENRFFPSPGNHDWNSPGLQPYLDYFSLPGNERYYDVLQGPVHIFVIDSDTREPDGISRDSIQAVWLRDGLAVSTAPWRLVVMHHPPFSSGRHGSSNWMQWPFAEWGATAVIAGHDHVYERIQLNGLTYFVNGLGGSPARYSFEELTSGSQVRFNADHGAMLIEANSERVSFQFITRTGRLIDTLVLEAN